MEDQDCIYDDLPEMCDISSSMNDEASTPFTESSTPMYLILEKSKSDESSQYVSKSSVKKCVCCKNIQWTWDNSTKSDFVEIMNNNRDVRFHKSYSIGTAVVRCTEPMSNHQYYWEVKMTYPVYGTDIMIGVGTSDAQLNHLQDRFVSLLGMDNKTWGLSYTGLFHHSGQRRYYAPGFGQGSVIGVHLDMWRGTLSFYKDRKYLGIASSGLKGKILYAMASSTAARSGMRIVCSCSFPSSLQFLCCVKLREIIPDDKNVLDEINLPPGLKQFLQNNLSWLLNNRSIEKNMKTCCNVVHGTQTDDEVADESSASNIISSSYSGNNPYGVSDQFILIGSVLLRNHNRHQQLIRNQSLEREESQDNETKRQRCS